MLDESFYKDAFTSYDYYYNLTKKIFEFNKE